MRVQMPVIDWGDMHEVIAFAKRLGDGVCVIMHPGRPNYNIIHVASVRRYPDAKVVYPVANAGS